MKYRNLLWATLISFAMYGCQSAPVVELEPAEVVELEPVVAEIGWGACTNEDGNPGVVYNMNVQAVPQPCEVLMWQFRGCEDMADAVEYSQLTMNPEIRDFDLVVFLKGSSCVDYPPRSGIVTEVLFDEYPVATGPGRQFVSDKVFNIYITKVRLHSHDGSIPEIVYGTYYQHVPQGDDL